MPSEVLIVLLPGYIDTTAPLGTNPFVTKTPFPAEVNELVARVTLKPKVWYIISSGLNVFCCCWLFSSSFTLWCWTASKSWYFDLTGAGSMAKVSDCLWKSFKNRAWKTFSNVPRTSSSVVSLSLDSSGTYRRVLKIGKVSIHYPLTDKSQAGLSLPGAWS